MLYFEVIAAQSSTAQYIYQSITTKSSNIILILIVDSN